MKSPTRGTVHASYVIGQLDPARGGRHRQLYEAALELHRLILAGAVHPFVADDWVLQGAARLGIGAGQAFRIVGDACHHQAEVHR